MAVLPGKRYYGGALTAWSHLGSGQVIMGPTPKRSVLFFRLLKNAVRFFVLVLQDTRGKHYSFCLEVANQPEKMFLIMGAGTLWYMRLIRLAHIANMARCWSRQPC